MPETFLSTNGSRSTHEKSSRRSSAVNVMRAIRTKQMTIATILRIFDDSEAVGNERNSTYEPWNTSQWNSPLQQAPDANRPVRPPLRRARQ
jgi:hypothetical protein